MSDQKKNNLKELKDFLPSKENFYFRKFEDNECTKQITKEQVIDELKKVKDPEIPVNLYDLGLIYDINIDNQNNISIDMTLTNPNCPVAGSLPGEVGVAIEKIQCLSSIKIKIVWYPKWDKSLMSEDAKLALDIF